MIKPLYDRIAVKIINDEKTDGGLMLSDAVGDLNMAEVVAVGDGIKNDKGENISMDIQVGDKIYMPKYVKNRIIIDGQEIHVVNIGDVSAKII